MHVSKLHIDGFRGLRGFEAEFKPGLNVVIGPNNAGKTALIDALRLALTPVNRASQSYFRSDDFSVGTDSATIRIEASELSAGERAMHLEALSLDGERVTFGKRFLRRAEEFRGYRSEYLVGSDNRVNDWYPAREAFQTVYLEPLRDAKKELASYSGNRLRRLVSFLASGEEVTALEDLLRDNDTAISDNVTIKKVRDAISTPFRSLTHFGSLNEPVISPSSQDLSMALRRLKMGLKESNQYWELDQIGLGYANLLYFASVLAELTHEAPDTHRILLIEEPEAHLHPQLQSSLVRVLQKSLEIEEGGQPAPQIILTTHSATLAAAAGVPALQGMSRSEGLSRHWQFRVDEAAERKLNRFFISRRPEALFAEFALLAEGISEEILLPVLFELRALNAFDEVHDEQQRHRLSQELRTFLREYLVVVAVHSVDFAPYVSLLTSSGQATTPRKRVFVLTDSDEDTGIKTDKELTPGESRAKEIRSVAERNQFPADQLHVCITPGTFEKELMRLAEEDSNEVLKSAIERALESLHKRKWAQFDARPERKVGDLWKLITSISNFSKGAFAQSVADNLLKEQNGISELPSGLEKIFMDLSEIFLEENDEQNEVE